MDGETRYSIGDLARRTGLTVKAIRFYSDRGIVPPTDRSPAGYRRYDDDAVARLDLVRTLRDLGLDLPTVRRVVDQEISLQEVAAVHAEALAVQIRTLRLRRAVLTAAARRRSTAEELELMHKLAKLSDDERRSLVGDFLDTAFDGLSADPELAGIARSLTPVLPDSPEPEQVEAWVELAELTQDQAFRAVLRRTAEQFAADRAEGGAELPRRDAVGIVRDQVRPALAAGIAPTSPEAETVVAAVIARYVEDVGGLDEIAARKRLLDRLEAANDPRRERYLQLLAVINGWPAPESLTPELTWLLATLNSRAEARPSS